MDMRVALYDIRQIENVIKMTVTHQYHIEWVQIDSLRTSNDPGSGI